GAVHGRAGGAIAHAPPASTRGVGPARADEREAVRQGARGRSANPNRPRRRSGARRSVPRPQPHPRALPPLAGAVVRYGLEHGQDCRLVSNASPEGEPSYGVPLARAGGSSADATNEQKPLTCDTNWGKISYDSRSVDRPR